jgi:hypothetical protein
MPPQNRVFGSVDPLDLKSDPGDLPNEDWYMGYPPCPPIAEEIRALRKKLRFTQREFAGYFGFPLATLRHWENGDRKPTGCAYVLLRVIHENPRVVLTAVRKARQRNSDRIAQIKPKKSFRAPPGLANKVWGDY